MRTITSRMGRAASRRRGKLHKEMALKKSKMRAWGSKKLKGGLFTRRKRY